MELARNIAQLGKRVVSEPLPLESASQRLRRRPPGRPRGGPKTLSTRACDGRLAGSQPEYLGVASSYDDTGAVTGTYRRVALSAVYG